MAAKPITLRRWAISTSRGWLGPYWSSASTERSDQSGVMSDYLGLLTHLESRP